MPLILVIAGVVVVLAGLVLIFTAQFQRPTPPKAQEDAFSLDKVLEELNKLLGQLDQKFRIGVVVMAVGLALIGFGAYFEAHNAKDAADKATACAKDPAKC